MRPATFASFEEGQFIAIRGRSGSGKSTLLNLMAGIDMPSSGDIVIAGVTVTRLSQRESALPPGLPAVGLTAVEQPSGRLDAVAERLVVGVPPEVADAARLPHELLDVDELVEAELRVRPAEAGVLHPAPGALAGAVGVHVVVDPHHAGLQLPRHALAAQAVAGPDRGAEAEPRVVGERDGLVLAVHGHDRQHRAEHLLAHDPHLVRDAREHGGRVKGRGVKAGHLHGASAAELGAGRHGVVDQLADHLELRA